MAPGLPAAVYTEANLTGTDWTDLSTLVKGDSIEIHVGRDSASSGVQPGTLDLDLDNADARFTPDNPLSSLYPNFKEGKRVRVQTRTTALGAGNLLSAEAASFEAGTVGGWAGNPFGYTASAVANTATFAQFGTKALLVTWPAAGAAGSGTQLTVTGLVIGRTYTLSAYVRVPAANPAVRIGELFGTVTMTAPTGFSRTSSTTGAFQRIAVTFDAAASTTYLGVVNATASSAGNTVVIDGVQLDEGSTVGTFTTSAATYSMRFVGRIAGLEPTFPTNEPTQSVTHLSAIDGLGDAQRSIMKPYTEAVGTTSYMGSDRPGFWPMTDKGFSRKAREITGAGEALVIRYVSNSQGKVEWGADADLDPDGQGFVRLTNGKGLWHSDPGMTMATGRYLSVWVKINDGAYGELLSLTVARRDVAGTYVTVNVNASGIYHESYLNGTFEAGSGPWSVLPGWHHIGVGVNAGFVELYIDGAATPIATSATGITSSFRRMSFGGSVDMSVGLALVHSGTPYLPSGWVEGTNTVNGVTINSVPTPLQYAAGLGSLSYTIGFSGTPDTSRPVTGVQSAGRSVLDVLTDLANTESGILWHEYGFFTTQTLRILAKASLRPSTVSLTIDAEADLDGAPVMERIIDGVVSVSTASSPAGVEVATATDLAPYAGSASVDVSSLLQADNDLYALATDALARGRYLRTRLRQIPIDLANAGNDLYAAFFALTPGARVRLSGLPSTYFGVTYLDGYAQGWTERPSVNGYGVVLDLDPADAPPEAVADDSTYGRAGWGDGVCTLSAGVTSSATSMTLTWASGDALSTAAGDYPLDLDVNGERVTITSAPAGGTSPRNVTVTRGVAPTVARAHSAGEPVDVWLAASAAL